MTILRFTKRNLLAIVAGFFTIILIGIITSTISFFLTSHIFRTFPASDIKSAFSQQPYITFSWTLRIISFMSPILGGLVVGWIIKERGWVYGGILGITIKLISISIVVLTLLLPASLIYGPNLPPEQGQGLAQKNILNQLLYAPITIIFTALGGYLGEFLYKRNRKKK